MDWKTSEKRRDYARRYWAIRAVTDAPELEPDRPRPVEADGYLGAFTRDAVTGFSRAQELAALEEIMARKLLTLNPRERDVLVRRFGLDGRPPQTLDEVGNRLDRSKEAVRQTEIKAFRKLRKDADLRCLFDGEEALTWAQIWERRQAREKAARERMERVKNAEALAKVESFFQSVGYTVGRKHIPMPVGSREVLTVGNDIIAVHPKDKPSFYRIGQCEQHGLRDSALRYYAANDVLLCIYEENTRMVLLGHAPTLLVRSRLSAMPGKFEGESEPSRFVNRDDLKCLGVVP